MKGVVWTIVGCLIAGGCDTVFGLHRPPTADAPTVDGRPIDGSGSVTKLFGGRTEVGTLSGTGVAADTFISDDTANRAKNYGSASTIFLCNTCNDANFSGDIVRGLLRFDISAIPPGSTVESAQLLLDTTSGGNLGSGNMGIFRMLEAWEEGTGPFAGSVGAASWSQRLATTVWSVAGAGSPTSRDGTPTVSFFPENSSTAYELDLVVLVRGWVAAPTTNHGVALLITSGTSDASFHSRESVEPKRRPGLRVTYTAP